MKKINQLVLVILFTNLVFAQENYKKALIPAKFKFQSEENQYRLNATLKAYFTEKGFEAFLDNEPLTEGFSNENCNKIFVVLESNNSLFVTKLTLKIKDCKNSELFTSIEGKSREKSLAKAYNDALMQVLKSIKNLNFNKIDAFVNTNVVEQKPIVANTNWKVKNSSLLPSSIPNVSFCKINGINGIVYPKNNKWFFEYEQNQKVIYKEIELED